MNRSIPALSRPLSAPSPRTRSSLSRSLLPPLGHERLEILPRELRELRRERPRARLHRLVRVPRRVPTRTGSPPGAARGTSRSASATARSSATATSRALALASRVAISTPLCAYSASLRRRRRADALDARVHRSPPANRRCTRCGPPRRAALPPRRRVQSQTPAARGDGVGARTAPRPEASRRRASRRRSAASALRRMRHEVATRVGDARAAREVACDDGRSAASAGAKMMRGRSARFYREAGARRGSGRGARARRRRGRGSAPRAARRRGGRARSAARAEQAAASLREGRGGGGATPSTAGRARRWRTSPGGQAEPGAVQLNGARRGRHETGSGSMGDCGEAPRPLQLATVSRRRRRRGRTARAAPGARRGRRQRRTAALAARPRSTEKRPSARAAAGNLRGGDLGGAAARSRAGGRRGSRRGRSRASRDASPRFMRGDLHRRGRRTSRRARRARPLLLATRGELRRGARRSSVRSCDGAHRPAAVGAKRLAAARRRTRGSEGDGASAGARRAAGENARAPAPPPFLGAASGRTSAPAWRLGGAPSLGATAALGRAAARRRSATCRSSRTTRGPRTTHVFGRVMALGDAACAAAPPTPIASARRPRGTTGGATRR